MTALDQTPQNFATGDQQLAAAQTGATNAWHAELNSIYGAGASGTGALDASKPNGTVNAGVERALAPVDSAHAAYGSLIGADVQTASADAPTGGKPIEDAKTVRLHDSQEAALKAAGLGDLAVNSQGGDKGGINEAVAQKNRENALASSLAFNNIFDNLGSGTAQAGFKNMRDGGTPLQFHGNPPLQFNNRSAA